MPMRSPAGPVGPEPILDAGYGDTRSQVTQLFQDYAPAVRAFFLRRLGNREDAREATQEVFLHLWQQERRGRLHAGARAYLFTAAANHARDCRRRARTRASDQHDSLDHDDLPDSLPEYAEIVHWTAGLRVVAQCMQELPAETQRIFMLYHGSRMSYTGVARHLRITTRTVERHMAQAIAYCKRRLQEYL